MYFYIFIYLYFYIFIFLYYYIFIIIYLYFHISISFRYFQTCKGSDHFSLQTHKQTLNHNIFIAIITMLDGQEQGWWWQEAGNAVPALWTRLNNFSVSCTSLLERINDPVSSAFQNWPCVSAH